VLKEADAGKPVKEICRQHGISDATYTSGNRSMAGWRPRI
jgi:putative transposase